MRGRNGRQQMVSRVHLTTHQQLQQLHIPSSSSSSSSWAGSVMVGGADSIARVGSRWLSTLPSTTPCTAVCTATALPSSFSTTTPVVSFDTITAFPFSSITTAYSICLATPTSLYIKEPHNTIDTCLLCSASLNLASTSALRFWSRPRPRPLVFGLVWHLWPP